MKFRVHILRVPDWQEEVQLGVLVPVQVQGRVHVPVKVQVHCPGSGAGAGSGPRSKCRVVCRLWSGYRVGSSAGSVPGSGTDPGSGFTFWFMEEIGFRFQ